jgi:valyl-tRNA synthetase
VAAPAASCDLFVDLADLVDVEAETARLDKEIEACTKSIAGKQAILANESFVARAKPEKVAEERARLAELEDKLAKARVARAALAGRKR